MKISLLIEPTISDKIIGIKSELYSKGVRVDGKTDVGVPHIKLAEADQPKNQTEIEKQINLMFEKYKENVITNFALVNEPRQNLNWIALQIHEEWLLNLSKEIESVLDLHQINRSKEYKQKIYEIRKHDYPNTEINLDECIADHLNLVSKCEPKMANLAEKSFNFLKEIKSIKPNSLLFEY